MSKPNFAATRKKAATIASKRRQAMFEDDSD